MIEHAISVDEQVARELARVRAVLAAGEPVACARVMGDLARDMRTRRALVRAIGDGFEMSFASLEVLAAQQREVPASWLTADMFADDAHFLPGRFFLTFAVATLSAEVEALAIEQARRLLTAGAVNPEFFTSLAGANSAFDTVLMMYMPERAARMRDLVAQGGAVANPGTYMERVLAETRERLAQIDAGRDELFFNEWLPYLLSAEEYARVQHLPQTLVRELYTEQYTAGYTGYRAAVLARTTPRLVIA